MSAADAHLADPIAFVLHEARLLDEQRYEQWLDLFTPDGWYWLPGDARHTDPLNQVAHLYDDHLLRQIRVRRVQSPQAFSQQPRGRCHHLMQLPQIEAGLAGEDSLRLRTAFIYTELRGGRSLSLPGIAWHDLRRQAGQWKIACKRVDLLHAGEPLPAVEFYI